MMPWIKSPCKSVVDRINNSVCSLKLLRTTKRPNGEKNKKATSPEPLQPVIATLSSDSEKNYFVEARSWADDMYTQVVISRNRYKMAFFIAMGLAIGLTIAIDGLIPMQHMEPLLIHHYQDGRVSVQPLKQPYAPTNQSQVESEIVRYVINRESFDPTSYDTQYSLINLLSSHVVAKEYMNDQSASHPFSPINVLGNHGFRSVHVDSVIFLDSTLENQGKSKFQQTHHNVAQVNFTLTDHFFKDSAAQKTKAFTAVLSWDYHGTPSNPSDLWRNWDGFTVTRYTVSPRNL